MNTGRRRSALSYIPGLTNNAVLQLIMFCAGAFVTLGICWAVIEIVDRGDAANFYQYILPNIALPHLAAFGAHWWTIFTYGFFSFNGFFEMLSNMLWLYMFGNIVQMLVGHRQVIPLFIYSVVAGGLFYLLAQLVPGAFGEAPRVNGIMGPRAGLIAMAAAAVTIAPDYRIYFTETFRVHIMVVAGIFAFLMIMSSGFYFPVFMMLAGGGLVGFAYIKMLKAGYRPGEWMYGMSKKVENLVTPDPIKIAQRKFQSNPSGNSNRYTPKSGITQKRIDDILDKINQKGYNSLSSEEKETLLRAGKE